MRATRMLAAINRLDTEDLGEFVDSVIEVRYAEQNVVDAGTSSVSANTGAPIETSAAKRARAPEEWLDLRHRCFMHLTKTR